MLGLYSSTAYIKAFDTFYKIKTLMLICNIFYRQWF